jgi:hypothetical protein
VVLLGDHGSDNLGQRLLGLFLHLPLILPHIHTVIQAALLLQSLCLVEEGEAIGVQADVFRLDFQLECFWGGHGSLFVLGINVQVAEELIVDPNCALLFVLHGV